MVLATAPGRAAGRAAGGRATSGWTATSPSPGGCWRSVCSGAGSSRPPPRCCSGDRRLVRRLHRGAEPGGRRPVTEEASKGLFLLLLLWWRRAELDGILDGIVYAGMVGIGFAFVENILYLGGRLQRHRRDGPGRHRSGDRRLRRPLPVQPVRAPAVHDVHRHRRRDRRRLAQPVGAGRWPRCSATCSPWSPTPPGTARRCAGSAASSASTSS